MRTQIRTLLAAVLAIAVLALAGCSDDATTRTENNHDDADVAFATGMIPHHAQALVMVDMTEGRDLDPAFTQLTDAIRAAQTPEIQTMSGWLEDWGKEVPDESGMGGMDMPGMMSDDDLDTLESSSGATFEARWLRMMIEHHQGAIEMAKVEIAEGSYPPAVDLATSIVTSQEAEIVTMKTLLG
jgi:uncharacterized protein (DUF305 family)